MFDERVGEELCGVASRAEEHASGTEQTGGNGRLGCLGRAGEGQTGRERARREPVIGQ